MAEAFERIGTSQGSVLSLPRLFASALLLDSSLRPESSSASVILYACALVLARTGNFQAGMRFHFEDRIHSITTVQRKIRNHGIVLNTPQHLFPACPWAAQNPHRFRKLYVLLLTEAWWWARPTAHYTSSFCSDFCFLMLRCSPAERDCSRN